MCLINIMTETYEQLNGDLPLRTKKNRLKKFQHKQLSSAEMKSSLQEMVLAGIKNTAIIDLLRGGLLNQKIASQERIRPKRVRSQAQEEIISKIEEKDFDFFTTKGETRHFRRSIDQVLSKLKAKMTVQTLPAMQETTGFEGMRSLSPVRGKLSKLSKESSAMSKRKQTTVSFSLGEGGFQMKKVIMKDISRKRSNTFLFNIPTRKLPKKTSQVEYKLERDWEEQLLENINILQGGNVKHKKNLKIERDKLSAYLKGRFVNEALTTYYKFQPTENFNFLKSVIEQLGRAGEKQLRLLTFFTYDVNQDGFICEEDIYYFLSRLPQRARILQDFNLIVEFLRANKLRSTSTGLPDKLIKLRQKSLLACLEDHSLTDAPPPKNSFTEKLFTVASPDRDTHISKLPPAPFKKFQINFEVFSLIFAERLPLLVPQIILSLTRAIPQPLSLPGAIPTPHSQSLPQSGRKEKDWVMRMGRSKQMVETLQAEKRRLSQKIE